MVSELAAPKNNVIKSAFSVTENISLPVVSKPIPKVPVPKRNVINCAIPVTKNILMPGVSKPIPDVLHVSNSTSSDLIENTNMFVDQNSSIDVDIELENRNTSHKIMDYAAKNIKKEKLSPVEIKTEYSKTNIYLESDIQNSTQNKKCLLCNPTDDALEINMAYLMKMHKEICMSVKIENDIVDNVNSTVDNSDCPLLSLEKLHNLGKDTVNDDVHNTTANDLQSWSRKRYNIRIRKKQREEENILIESHQDITYSNACCTLPILKESLSDFEQNEINRDGGLILPNDQNTSHNSLTTFLDMQIKGEPPDFDEYRECVNVSSFVSSPVEVKKQRYDLSADTCPTPGNIHKASLELNHLQEETSNISMELLFSESYESFGHSSHSSQVEDINSESQRLSLSPVMPYDHSKKKTKNSFPKSGYREHSSHEYSGFQVNTNLESQKPSLSQVKADNNSKKNKSCLLANSFNKDQSDCSFSKTEANILHTESSNDRMEKTKLEKEKVTKDNEHNKEKKKYRNLKIASQKYKLQRESANARNQRYIANLSEEKRSILRAKARERYYKKRNLV